MSNIIYTPSGRAAEYSPLAANTGDPYCHLDVDLKLTRKAIIILIQGGYNEKSEVLGLIMPGRPMPENLKVIHTTERATEVGGMGAYRLSGTR